MPASQKINRKNLKTFCHVAGFGGIAGLCRVLKISRNTAYQALEDPKRYPNAHPRIIKALNVKN
jgi:hypothetical protein